MSNSDDETNAILNRILDTQKLTAKSVADLAVGLNEAERHRRNDIAEIHGSILGMRGELHASRPRRRRDSIEDTKKFKLPGFEETDQIQLSRRTQRKIIRWVILAAAAIFWSAAQFVWHHEIAHTLHLPDREDHGAR